MVRMLGEEDVSLMDNELYGYQEDFALPVVDCMVEALSLGHELPRVDLVYDKGIYRIRFCNPVFGGNINYNRGGHHRSLAFLKSGLPLRANIWDCHNDDESGLYWMSIKEMTKRDFLGSCDLSRFMEALSYLPRKNQRKILRSFCKEYHLRKKDFLDDLLS